MRGILTVDKEGGTVHLKKTKRGNRIYLSVVQNYREGRKTRTKTIESIGYVDEFADRYADPIGHFQEYVNSLNAQRKAENPPIGLTFARDARIDPDHVASARWGSAIALAYLDALGVRDFFESRAGHEGFPSHAGRIFEMLASERIIHVASKRESWERRASFPRPCAFSLVDVYRALDCFAANAERLVRAMNAAYRRIRGSRRRSEAYVVFAPLAFADTGDVDPAERPAGRSATGLAMILDEDTIPVSFRLVSVRPTAHEYAALAREARMDTGGSHVVVVTASIDDATGVMAALSRQGDGFVLYRPVREILPDLRTWIDDPQGYIATQSGSYRVKSRVDYVNVEAGKDMPVKELVLWGRDFARRSRQARGGLLSSEADDTRGADSLDGYLCLVTSETKRPEAVIFHLYREIWRLAEPFQVMESDFSPSPYPIAHRTHIEAHFLICYVAFFALRVMRADMGWRYNAAQVADALLRMEGAYLDENWFLFSYRSEITDAIEEAAGVDVARRLRTPPQIRRDIARARRHIEGASSVQNAPAEKEDGAERG